MTTPTRGERNNNPGNIREYPHDGVAWKGERATDDDPAFEEFNRPEDGIRALAKILLAYYRKHNLHTVREIINRWAPPNENDTGAYVDAVCKQCTVAPDDPINVENESCLEMLVRGIIHHENGRVIYDDPTIVKGIELALA